MTLIFDNKTKVSHNMTMKTCSMCKQQKVLSDFNKNKARKDGLQTQCRDCFKDYYNNKYYSSDKEQLRLKNNRIKRRDIVKSFLRNLKSSTPCVDCKVKYPYYVMDFDHLGEQQKDINISAMAWMHTLAEVKIEIEKCELVCSNCHRERTFRRLKDIPL